MDLEGIKCITQDFREGKDSVWKGVARCLTERGIDIQKVVIASSFPEDVAQYYVLAITSDKKVFEFYYDFLHKDPSEGEIVEWKDFTNDPNKAYMHEDGNLALKHLNEL